MRVNRTKLRWMRWARYVQRTQSLGSSKWHTGIHAGQAKAYQDVMRAHRWVPNGVRAPYYPRWAEAK